MAFSFKDCIMSDIDDTFLDLQEFSDRHRFQIGSSVLIIPCQVDESEVINREMKASSHSEGIHTRQFMVYVRQADMIKPPVIRQPIVFDGKTCLVIDVVDELGVYSITLEENRSQRTV